MQLPDIYLDRMKDLLKSDYDKYIACFSKNAKRGFTVNQNYIKNSDFLKIFAFNAKPIEGFKNCFELLTEEKLGKTVYFHAGLIYMQEPSSMLAVNAMEVCDGEKILDLCSAPGGKTSQILSINQAGIVVANEIVKSRASILQSNIERQGFKNCLITSLETEKLAENFLGYFDKILVDAPCSGEGMFRKDQSTISEWNAGLAEYNHQRQLEILKQADKMLKTGGTLIYSTCTFNVTENEHTVLKFSSEFGYSIQELCDEVKDKVSSGKAVGGNVELTKCGRCYPFNDFGEGQFVAKLVKQSEAESYKSSKKDNYQQPSKAELTIAKEFLVETIGRADFNYYKVGNNIFISEVDFPFVKYGIINIGVRLGEIVKNRLVVHHQFFKAFGKEMKNKIDLAIYDERVNQYISGNEIASDKTGYVCVLVNGVPLGGGKASGGKLKNHYPKALRGQIV